MIRNYISRFVLLAFLLLALPLALAITLKGRVSDPQGNALPGASVKAVPHSGGEPAVITTSGPDGRFELQVATAGNLDITIEAAGFLPVTKSITVRSTANPEVEFRLAELATVNDSVSVTADVNETDVFSPDPAEKVFVRQDLLDANPGRPGAPVSIPGYPIETASSGIKAPQYFAPGVAGDHGEPIAQYISVGTYLLPNNLSANAHGNGYADPNILISAIIESVKVDGGAYDVREGNHSVNQIGRASCRERV